MDLYAKLKFCQGNLVLLPLSFSECDFIDHTCKLVPGSGCIRRSLQYAGTSSEEAIRDLVVRIMSASTYVNNRLLQDLAAQCDEKSYPQLYAASAAHSNGSDSRSDRASTNCCSWFSRSVCVESVIFDILVRSR
ncbi:hypothetical protein IQ07DRAFT_587107 [Pyrenochaeta sp. DS3sAY3a]|nr:hypothetical protein IQ07DRAFT_587107 [Pyrenochaeta sp. DS3sAY3a]